MSIVALPMIYAQTAGAGRRGTERLTATVSYESNSERRGGGAGEEIDTQSACWREGDQVDQRAAIHHRVRELDHFPCFSCGRLTALA